MHMNRCRNNYKYAGIDGLVYVSILLILPAQRTLNQWHASNNRHSLSPDLGIKYLSLINRTRASMKNGSTAGTEQIQNGSGLSCIKLKHREVSKKPKDEGMLKDTGANLK